MKHARIIVFVSLLFVSCVYGYTVRQTIMERQHEDGFTERLILVHDYHKADRKVSVDQSKALVELFTKIRAQDPSAELFLERPELNDLIRKIGRFSTTLSEHNEASADQLPEIKFEMLKKNGAALLSGLPIALPSLTQQHVQYLLPLLYDLFERLRMIPGFGDKQEDQLLGQLSDAFKGVDGVRYLDNRVGVVSLAATLSFAAILLPFLFDTPSYMSFVKHAAILDVSLHHVFSYINVFLDETIERCEHAQLFFTACPDAVRAEINAVRDSCIEVKRVVASHMQGLMQDGMYKVSIADFMMNIIQYVHGKKIPLSAVAERYEKALAQNSCALDAYMQTAFVDMYGSLLNLLVRSSRQYSLYDVWIASELIRSSAKTIVIVTGAAHAETLIKLLKNNGYETLYDSPLYLSNGMRINGVEPFLGSKSWVFPTLPRSWCAAVKMFANNYKTGTDAMQALYHLLSVLDVQVVGMQRYHELIDVKPLDVSFYDYALLSAEELKTLQGCCLHDQHHVLRTAWHMPQQDEPFESCLHT